MAISQPIHYREDSIDGSDPFIELYLELRDQLDQLHRVAESDDPRVRDFVGDIEEMIDDFNHRSQHKEYSAHSYLRNQITQAKKILRMVGQAPSKSAGRKYVEAAAATRGSYKRERSETQQATHGHLDSLLHRHPEAQAKNEKYLTGYLKKRTSDGTLVGPERVRIYLNRLGKMVNMPHVNENTPYNSPELVRANHACQRFLMGPDVEHDGWVNPYHDDGLFDFVMGYGKFKGLNEDLSDAGRERRLAAGKIVAYYNSYIDKHGEEGKALARDFLKKLGKAVDMSDQIHENTDIEEEKSWIAIACNKYQGDKMGLAEDHKHRDSFFNLWYTGPNSIVQHVEKNVRSEPEKPDVIIIPADAGSPPKPEPKPHVLEPAPEEVEVLKATVEEITISNAFNIEHFSLKVDGKTIALDPKKDNLAKGTKYDREGKKFEMPDYGGLLSHKLESKVHARMDELFEVFKKKADPKEALDTLNEWCNLLQEHAYGLYTQARKDLELSGFSQGSGTSPFIIEKLGQQKEVIRDVVVKHPLIVDNGLVEKLPKSLSFGLNAGFVYENMFLEDTLTFSGTEVPSNIKLNLSDIPQPPEGPKMREKFRELVEEIKRDVSSYDSAKRTQQTNLLNQTAREAGIDVDLLDLESGDHAAYYNADRLLKFRGEALKVAHDISVLSEQATALDRYEDFKEYPSAMLHVLADYVGEMNAMKTKFANHASHVAVQGNLVTDMDSSIETVSEHIDETRDALVDMRTPEKTQGFKDRFDDALLAINEQLKQGQVPTLDFDTIFDVNGGEQKDKDIAQIGRDLIDEAAKEATSEFEFIRLLEHKLVQAQASGDFLFTLDQSQLIMTVIEYIPVVYPKSYTDGKLQKILATGKMTNDQKGNILNYVRFRAGVDSLGVQADSEFALSNDNSLDPDRINDLVQKILTAKEPMSLEQIRTEFLEGAGTDASEDVNDAIGNIVTFLRSLKEPDPRANTYDHIQLKLSTDEAVDEPEEPSDDAATAPDPLDAMSQQDFANALAGNSIGQAQKGTESGPQPNETPENPKPDTVSPEELAEVLNSTRIQAPKTTTQSSGDEPDETKPMWETFTIRPGLSDSNDNSNADTTTKSSNDSGNVLRSSEPIRGTLLTKHPKFDVGEGTYFDISKYEFTTEEDLKRYDELGRPLGDDLPKGTKIQVLGDRQIVDGGTHYHVSAKYDDASSNAVFYVPIMKRGVRDQLDTDLVERTER